MDLAPRIDHTLLKPEADADAIDQLNDEAIAHGFATVCVNGCHVERVARRLEAAAVPTVACGVAGFPLGAGKSTVIAIEAASLVKDGAAEVDMVAPLPLLLRRQVEAGRAWVSEVVRAARAANPRVIIKLIIESAVLMSGASDTEAEGRIETACRIARESGCDFVKTSTGFHPAGGATAAAVKLMRAHAGPLKVKAAGGIRTRDDAMRMIEAGADRLGCSASVAIVKGAMGADAAAASKGY